jgi:hypothetical protein
MVIKLVKTSTDPAIAVPSSNLAINNLFSGVEWRGFYYCDQLVANHFSGLGQ